MSCDCGNCKICQKSTFGWKVKMNHVFPERRTQEFWPKLIQIIPMIPLIIRYFIYTIKSYIFGVKPVMDFLKPRNGMQIYGVPIGGIGCGTIGRGFKGEFCRYQLIPGIYKYNIVAANQFIVTLRENNKTVYQQVLSPYPSPKKELCSWKWEFPGGNAEYCALYPRSWTVYRIPEHNIVLTCRQVSPIIPHNYKDSSVPGAAFVWTVENTGNEKKEVSITFSFKNGYGGKEDKEGGCWNELFEESDITGVRIHQTLNGMPCTYALGAKRKHDISVTTMTSFDPCSDGNELWQDLLDDGQFEEGPKSSPETKHGEEIAAAVCVKINVAPQNVANATIALVWDMPKIHFSESKITYTRFYTKYFGDSGGVANVLCKYVLDNYKIWEERIKKWQDPILSDMDLPDWFKCALFNETYYVSDGGSIWLTPFDSETLDMSDPRREFGHFAYLEGHEYRMCNTYDVHYYASFALAKLWPSLQEVLQYDFMDSITNAIKSKRWMLYDGAIVDRKVLNSVPHDLGDPYEDPFVLVNAYPVHDVSKWKDLNLKFILQCYRDWKFFGNKKFISKMWPKIRILMQVCQHWCTNDSLIENSGFPDQTYDSWVMTGPSAYCSSLWIGALYCAQEIALTIGDEKTSHEYLSILNNAKAAFEKRLWNGEYYNFDSAKNSGASTIMADQLCGLWYLRASGVKSEIFKDEHVKSALKKVFDFNVMKFKNGSMGAVNGMTPEGVVDLASVQSEEMWCGVAYGVAALMIHEGMIDEGFKTAHGVYNTVYNVIGMGFETPEALYEKKWYRAIGYMRPLSIWAIYHAWEMYKAKKQL